MTRVDSSFSIAVVVVVFVVVDERTLQSNLLVRMRCV